MVIPRVLGTFKKRLIGTSIRASEGRDKVGVVSPESGKHHESFMPIVLTCVSFALARNDAAYPLEKVDEFLVEKLDVTTLPPEIQPRPGKGKKTFEDYG